MIETGRPRVRLRPVAPTGWWFDILLVAAFTGLTVTLAGGHLLRLDVAVRNWCDDHQPRPLYILARAGNLLGQGGFFTIACLLVALYWVRKRHSVRPVLPVVMAFVLTFVSLTLLKDLTDRAAPHAPVPAPETFGSGGVSYPSGHLANAFVWYGVLALLLAPWLSERWRRGLRIAPVVILSVTTVYLGFHWLTDTMAGILLGLLLWRLIARVSWDDLPIDRWLAARGRHGRERGGEIGPGNTRSSG